MTFQWSPYENREPPILKNGTKIYQRNVIIQITGGSRLLLEEWICNNFFKAHQIDPPHELLEDFDPSLSLVKFSHSSDDFLILQNVSSKKTRIMFSAHLEEIHSKNQVKLIQLEWVAPAAKEDLAWDPRRPSSNLGLILCGDQRKSLVSIVKPRVVFREMDAKLIRRWDLKKTNIKNDEYSGYFNCPIEGSDSSEYDDEEENVAFQNKWRVGSKRPCLDARELTPRKRHFYKKRKHGSNSYETVHQFSSPSDKNQITVNATTTSTGAAFKGADKTTETTAAIISTHTASNTNTAKATPVQGKNMSNNESKQEDRSLADYRYQKHFQASNNVTMENKQMTNFDKNAQLPFKEVLEEIEEIIRNPSSKLYPVVKKNKLMFLRRLLCLSTEKFEILSDSEHKDLRIIVLLTPL